MDTLDAICTRRSIRKYLDRPVPKDVLQQVLRAAMYAPSACNAQPWQFVVIEDRKLLCEVPDIHSYAAMAAQAPLAILVCGDTSLEKVPGYWVIDCAAAVQNLLQATASKNSSRFNPGSHAGPKGAPAGQASTQAVQVPQQQVSTGVPKGNGASVSTVM